MAKKKAVAKPKKKMGRPTQFRKSLATEICERLSRGITLIEICRDPDMPNKSTVFRWLEKHPDFCDNYKKAREVQAEHYAEEIMAIADETQYDVTENEDGKPMTNWEHINRSKLKIDARKWFASKVYPKKFSDRVQQEISGPDQGPIQTETINRPPDLTRDEWLQLYAGNKKK